MGVLIAPRSLTRALLISSLPLVLLAAACGGGGPSSRRPLPGPTGRINPIYDTTLAYPDTTLIIDGMPYTGLEIDLEIEFDDPTLRDGDTPFTGEARVIGVSAGGIAQHFVLHGPLLLDGTLDGDVLFIEMFGPIHVGTASLLPEMVGTVQEGAGRVTGEASLFGIADDGFFTAIKRRRYLLTGTDLLSIGKVSVLSVRYDTRFSIDNDLEIVSSDPVARVEDGRPLVVNRYSFDNLQGLDPFRFFTTSFEHSTGNGSNPHDVVLLPPEQGGTVSGFPAATGAGLAFVTRYEPPFNDVAVIDLEDGSLVESIDLSPYAMNPDRLPRADQALLHDGLIYVTLQDANARFTEFGTGRVAVIDPTLRAVVDVLDLSGQNPFESLTWSAETGLIYVGLAGIFPGLTQQALTGGVEAIDPVTRRALGLVVDDDDLGGNVTAVAIHSADRGYCVVADASFRNVVKAFDPSTGLVLGTVYESPDRIAAMTVDGDGYLLIAEGFFAPRLVVLDAVTAMPVASLALPLPPFSVAILTRGL